MTNRRNKTVEPFKILTDSEIDKLEEFMTIRNLKLSKNDISYAARYLNLSIKRSLLYFETVKDELEQSKLNDNKRMIKRIKKIYKNISEIEKRIDQQN